MKKLYLYIITLSILIVLTGCMAQSGEVKISNPLPDTLYVYNDGSMQFRDRIVDTDDVVIYPDGYGGERAAIKVRVPISNRSDFYRDTITVVRKVGVN